MTIRDKVLIIGAPFLYERVDTRLLMDSGLIPYFLYEGTKKAVLSDASLFINKLSFKDVLSLVQISGIDYLVCFNDNFLIESAKIRGEAGLQGVGPREIGKYKIKSQMYKAVGDKVSTIPFLPLTQQTKYEDVRRAFGAGEYFIKPDYMAGSEGTGRCADEKEFNELKNRVLSRYSSVIVQPYVDKPLYHCELYVKDTKVIYINARKYSYPNHNILSGKIIASLPIFDSDKRAVIENAACIVKDSLDFNNGVMHTEFFWDEISPPQFLETNIRQAGGGINLIHKKRTGMSMETAMILLETGREAKLEPNNESYYTSGYIPRKKGVVKSFDPPELKGDVKFDFRVKEGDCLEEPTSASDAAVSYLGEYKKYTDLIQDFDTIEKSDIVLYE